MQIVTALSSNLLAAEGQEVVTKIQGGLEKLQGYLYSGAHKINIAEEGPPVYRYLQVTMASQDGILPSPADFPNYTVNVTIDIVPNE